MTTIFSPGLPTQIFAFAVDGIARGITYRAAVSAGAVVSPRTGEKGASGMGHRGTESQSEERAKSVPSGSTAVNGGALTMKDQRRAVESRSDGMACPQSRGSKADQAEPRSLRPCGSVAYVIGLQQNERVRPEDPAARGLAARAWTQRDGPLKRAAAGQTHPLVPVAPGDLLVENVVGLVRHQCPFLDISRACCPVDGAVPPTVFTR